ncbi:MAG: pyruvate kinase [Chloroflexi bacterium]|nr:pyruvate kinase [Chloroflexota bacterium]MCI0577991.1 pyruvate kinase [Chloroflexota bacterium]MCI0646980.1 pyruvate kinase [Chloroflexota bacterium]MCI0729261.1 pyruvate kinase [Chloroflexota bacterium]
MARTKIVATIGPASNNIETIRRMLRAGMNVARVNFSHGDHETHAQTVRTLREAAAAENRVLAILGDLQGPKLRLGYIKAGGIQLATGDEVVLTPHRGQPAMLHLPHPDLIKAVEPGARLVVGDGEVEMVVTEKQADTLRCKVTVAGLLEARKGISAPGTSLPIPSVTAKDRADMRFICELDLDFVALSFVRSAADIRELRQLMTTWDRQPPIIAKIEKTEAIDHLEEILEAADGVMVARGDLGIELPPQEVPLVQKRIIKACNAVGKPVITATQMLQSMVDHPRPTRAEASDVANAILDGTDAVMLSQETASGKYPVESVLMMKQIGEITEREFPYDLWRVKRQQSMRGGANVTEAISAASCAVAEEVKAQAIVSTTMTGYTARQIARHRPFIQVMAVSPVPEIQRQLALVWGVECLLVPKFFKDTDDMLKQTIEAIKPLGLKSGDRIVITAGIPFGRSGHTNLIQVHEMS